MSTPDRVQIRDTEVGQVLEIGTSRRRPVPRRFRIVEVLQEGTRVILRSDDGRVLAASPGQLSVVPYLIPAQHNPDHDEQDERAFLDASRLPAGDVADSATSLVDPVFGEFVVKAPSIVGYTAEIPEAATLGGRPVALTFDGAGGSRIEELLPAVREVVADLSGVLGAALDHLWEWGREESDTDEDRSRFLDSFGLEAVTIYHSGDFGVDLSDDRGVFEQAFMDGYWPKVHFRGDGTPVAVTVEA
ncbi:hypothetical protein LCL87_17545 [Rhodococcus hoagii]|nr:hypothetical protein [Prescottella equi]